MFMRMNLQDRYFVGYGTSVHGTFQTATELNEWFDAQYTEGKYFCRLYDRIKNINMVGSRYMRLKPEERWHDDDPL